jgi:hypothetical protein
MFTNAFNSKKQGDVGTGYAVALFNELGYIVSLPFSDNQAYDLIIDDGERLRRVQVKTTRFKHVSGNFEVSLKTCGGNRSGSSIKVFDHTKVDDIFVLTSAGKCYLIPTYSFTAKTALSLTDKYAIYILRDLGCTAQLERRGGL